MTKHRGSILKPSHGDSSNGGLSSKFDAVVIYTDDEPITDAPENAVRLVRRIIGSREVLHLEPIHRPEDDRTVGPMAGGTYVSSYDYGVFGVGYVALSLHDRFESQALYDALSR